MLGLIDRFLNETATLERRTGTDAYSGDTFSAPKSIKVRWMTENTVVLLSDRREVVSDSHISCTDEVAVGDRVTDEAGRKREVLTVRLNRSTRGVFSHYVAYLG